MSKGRQTRDGATVRRVQVTLDEITIERAKALGDGNLSIGLRKMAKGVEVRVITYQSPNGETIDLSQSQAAKEQKMTYLINIENTGLATDDQAREGARILSAAGYDVQFTRNFGLVNPTESCPCTDAEWEEALIAADKAFPA